jgi:hypothetical protein
MYGWNVKTGGLCSPIQCIIIINVLVVLLFKSQYQDMNLSNWMAPSKQSRKGVLDTESSISQNKSNKTYENSRNVSWENSNNASTDFTLTVVEDCHHKKFEKMENIEEKFFFWWGGQPKLCDLIKEMKRGVSNLRSEGIQSILNLSINCTNLIQNGGLGTGNWLIGWRLLLFSRQDIAVSGMWYVKVLVFLKNSILICSFLPNSEAKTISFIQK